MNIKFWGVRSSRPVPLTQGLYNKRLIEIINARESSNNGDSIETFLQTISMEPGALIGGNSTCVSLENNQGIHCIFDCGSGIHEYGKELMKTNCSLGNGKIHIFLSHLHLDRINGLIGFAPLHCAGNEIHFYYPENGLERNLIQIHSPPFHEHSLDCVEATCFFHKLNPEESLQLGDLQIECQIMMHPGSSYAYKIKRKNFQVIYAGSGRIETAYTQNPAASFFKNSNIVILGARPQEKITKKDWGHTDYQTAIRFKSDQLIDHLFLINHVPDTTDKQIWNSFYQAISQIKDPEKIYLAREGQSIYRKSK